MSLSMAALSVYLVEPSPTQAKFITAQLKSLGAGAIAPFTTGAAALQAMRAQPPDVVISSLHLPDITGDKLVAAMRSEKTLQQVAFILVSSETRPQALEPVRQLGVCGILPKPFDRSQLELALRSACDYLGDDEALCEEIDGAMLRVLIVDDSPSARHFIRRVLENLGVDNFIEASNGLEAAAILDDTMIDLVVTDYNMPEMDGQALVEHIRSKSWQKSVPVLMVTSEANAGRLAAVQEAGVSGICDKPFEPAVVKRLLLGMLAD